MQTGMTGLFLRSKEPVNGDRTVATADVPECWHDYPSDIEHSYCRWHYVRCCGLGRHRARTGTSWEQATNARLEYWSSQHRTGQEITYIHLWKMHQNAFFHTKFLKNFLGKGHSPSPDFTPTVEGDTSPHLPPQRLRCIVKIYTTKSNSWVRPWCGSYWKLCKINMIC